MAKAAENKPEKLKLGLDLKDYYYESRNCDGQSPCRWIEYNHVQGLDFSEGCPAWANQGYDAYGAPGKCNLVYYLLGKDLAAADQGVKNLTKSVNWGDAGVRDVVFRDPLCGRCDSACKRGLDLEIHNMLEALRVSVVEKSGPHPNHQEVTGNIENTGNRFGKPQADRQKWVPADAKPAAEATLLYFAGCRASFTDTGIAKATARLINAAGEKYMVLPEERCCGHFLYVTGQADKARKQAEANLAALKKSGAKQIVFSCAEGYRTVKVDYPKLLGISTRDLPFEVLHITELAARWLKDGKLKFTKPVNTKVTYHDPCNLGRLSEPWHKWEGTREKWGIFQPARTVRRGVHGVYEQPRDLLKAIPGLELVEMVRNRDNGFCCCADAGVKEAYPDFAEWGGKERLREAAHVGAEALVSACPACKENFSAAAGKGGLPVWDITELMARAIGK